MCLKNDNKLKNIVKREHDLNNLFFLFCKKLDERAYNEATLVTQTQLGTKDKENKNTLIPGK